jgi:uncharacterized protein (TIGR03437 family)
MKHPAAARVSRTILLALGVFAGLLDAQTVTPAPTSLTFSYQSGNALPAAQTVSVRISSGTPAYSVTITGAGTLWLTATPDSGRMPATLGVRVNPTSLAVGQYTATVVVTVTGVVLPVNIPVTLNVSAPLPTLSVSATTLVFSSPPAPPAAQVIRLSTSGSPISYTAVTAGAAWMQVSPASGVLLPGAQVPVTVSVDPTGLNPKALPYIGKITISAPGATVASKTQTITVSLTVNSVTPTISSLWPSSIPLNASATTITIRGANFYTASVAKVVGVTAPLVTTVLGSDALLAVVPAALLNTAATLNVVVSNPAPGGDSASTPLTVAAGASIQAVVSAASEQAGPVAPGELITLFGSDIGPTTPSILADADADGFVDTTLGTMTATVDGIAAPLVYVSQNQITLQVPYAVTLGAGKIISLTKGAGVPITSTVTIAATSPGLFTIDGSGIGQAAALNYNATTLQYSVNAGSNAAKLGDTVVLFATGEGDYATAISPRTGLIFPSTISPVPQLAPIPTVIIGGAAATVAYAGPSVGSMLGLLQINVVIPAGSTTGAAVPVSITIGGNQSPAGVTLALKP